MLGKVHINRKPVKQPLPTPGVGLGAGQQQQQQQDQGQAQGQGQGQGQGQVGNANDIPGYFVPQDQNGQYAGTTDVDMANSMGWSMDLMGDFPFMADDPYSSGGLVAVVQ